jgi:hypothetical protein
METLSLLQGITPFPIELGLARSAPEYRSTGPVVEAAAEEECGEVLQAVEAKPEMFSMISEFGDRIDSDKHS